MTDEPADPRIARNKRRRRVMIAAGVILAVSVAWIFRPHWHAAESLIDPRLRALKKPYRLVDSTTIFDGGSIRIRITGMDGHTEYFFIPCGEKMPKVYVLKNPNDPGRGSPPASNHAATLQELAAILSEHCENWWHYGHLAQMTGRQSDLWKAGLYKGLEKLQDWWKEKKW